MVSGRYPHKWSLSIARIRAQWRSGGPVVTVALMAACVAVWLVEVVTRYLFPTVYATLLGATAFSPSMMVAEPWTAVTSMFVHSINISHIVCNMISLWVVGMVMERALGHWRFLAVYLLCGLGGDLGLVVSGLVAPSTWWSYAVGASGAIFGMFGALLVVYRRLGIDIRGMAVWMAINFAMPLFVPNIAWQAHVGGFVIGAAVMALIWQWSAWRSGRRRSR